MTSAMAALHFGAPVSDEPFEIAAKQTPVVTLMSDVQPEMVRWLWPGWLPLGKLVVLDGDPSLGKSTLSLTFAAVVTTGGRWPDGASCDHPGGVVLLSAEDGLADTVRPRLDAAGADPTKVAAIEGVRVPSGGGKSTVRPMSLADIDHLRTTIGQVGARLLIIDVLMAFLPVGTDAHRDQDVRRILHRLGEVATEAGCTILLLRHLNKTRGSDALYRGGGSIGIVGAARAGLLVATSPDDETQRILAPTKSNLGAMPRALAYELADSPEHGCARVIWRGSVDHTATSLLAESPNEDGPTDRTQAEEWLANFVDDNKGEVSARDAIRAAERDGIGKTTLTRARKRLGIVSGKPSFGGGWVWRVDEEPTKRPKNPGHAEMAPSVSSADSSLCDGCGLALDPALGDESTHPACDEAAIAHTRITTPHVIGEHKP